MTKRIKSNYKGQITFMEDMPIHPVTPAIDEAVIFKIAVKAEISDDFTKMFIVLGFSPVFYTEKTGINQDNHFVMDLEYNTKFLRHFCYSDGIKINCEIFKNKDSIHLLGYFYPDATKGMRNFYFHGDLKRIQM